MGRPFAAADECRQALQLAPTQPRYYRLLAQCLSSTHPEEAVAAYCAMLAHEPLDFATYQALGELFRGTGTPERGDDGLQIILDRDANDSKARRGLGQVLMERGRFAEAPSRLRESGR